MPVKSLSVWFGRSLLTMVFGGYLLLFFSYFPNEIKSSLHSNIPQTKSIKEISFAVPVRLLIPQINVNAVIKQVGVTPEGAMEVPSNINDAGWFKLGPRPGEKGSSVVSGHFDGKNGEGGVFVSLYRLKKGDKLYIIDNRGTSIIFEVREIRIYDPGYASDVFEGSDSAHLNLVTCDGVWDGSKKSYTKRLVVFTDIMK